MLCRGFPPYFIAQNFVLQHTATIQGNIKVSASHESNVLIPLLIKVRKKIAYATYHYDMVTTDSQEIMQEIKHLTLLQNVKYQMILRK